MIKQTNKSKILVLAIVVLGVAVSLLVNNYLVGGVGTQADLKQIDCYAMFPTIADIQSQKFEISQEQTCKIINMIANMKPVDMPYKADETDPWHYFGRIRISPQKSVWFIIFMAKKSNGYKPVFSLQRRRGSGWGVVGQFDARNVLTTLGWNNKIDLKKLEDKASLVPTDYNTPF